MPEERTKASDFGHTVSPGSTRVSGNTGYARSGRSGVTVRSGHSQADCAWE